MSIERALIARAKPYVLAARLDEILSLEVCKGCLPDISIQPVSLEPHFIPAHKLSEEPPERAKISVLEIMGQPTDFTRVQVWISPKHNLQWLRAERFIRILQEANHRIGFEIIGNEKDIRICFLVHKEDLDLLKVALAGEFPCSALSEIAKDEENKDPVFRNLAFRDFFPHPPYMRRFTQSDQLHMSPYEPFINALAMLPEQVQGFSQALFEPAIHNWHQNVEVLLDLEFMSKLMGDPRSPYRHAQQAPSGDLRNMAQEVETKAHNDKPFYFTALRVGVLSSGESPPNIQAVASFAKLFQQGGRPLRFLTQEDYLQHLSPDTVNAMLLEGRVYRPGFLVNSSELAGLVHLPSSAFFIEKRIPIKTLETLTIRADAPCEGIIIGKSEEAGIEKEIHLPPSLRTRSCHLIGRHGMGKSSVMEHMVLQDMNNGDGVAVIDPHGDLVEKLLYIIPEALAHKVIYLDFSDPEWVPVWNPLSKSPGQSLYRIADELVTAIKNIVGLHNWGDRLEHLLRHGIYGLLHLPGSTLQDLSDLLEEATTENKEERSRLKKLILEKVVNRSARKFWKKKYDSYRREDFSPPQHKLSKLLMSDESVAQMLCQPDSLIDFREIMNSQKVILINLSSIGPEARGILGCFILSLFYLGALARSKLKPEERKAFHIYCDEAHKLASDSLEDILVEIRKYGVSLTLAHQFLRQFEESQRDALSSVGTTIIFNVNVSDARYLVNELREKVEPRDLFDLKVGEAIARIDTEIVRIKTLTPLKTQPLNSRERIIQQSRDKYYRHISKLKKTQKWYAEEPLPRSIKAASANPGSENPAVEAFVYDEFE